MSKRLIAFGLVVATGLVPGSAALAWYGDVETSAGNVFSASNLDLTLRDVSNVVLTGLLFDEDDFGPGSEETGLVRLKNDGSLDATYGTWSVKTGGDTGLCDALQLEAEVDGSPVYDGSLTGFNEDPVGTLLSGASDDWDFGLSLDDDDAALSDKTCEFDLVFKGWQTDSDGTWGFTDTELVSNEVTTDIWAAAGDVVINEIMWMGSAGDSDDEWMELRNMTSSPVDLTGWTIDGATSGLPGTLALAGTLPADDYFLISRKTAGDSAINDGITPDMVESGLSFVNGGEVLTLKNQFDQTIDETPAGAWAAGENGSAAAGTPAKRSMERNDTPSDGTVAGNWHSCIDVVCNDTTYWDVEGDDYGTPKALNHSDNDLSLIAEEAQQPFDSAQGEQAEGDSSTGSEQEESGEQGEEGEEEEGDGGEEEGTGEEESGEGEDGEEGDSSTGSEQAGDDGTEGKEDDESDEGEEGREEESGDDEENTSPQPSPSKGEGDDTEDTGEEEPGESEEAIRQAQAKV